jgi:hypothetical protein
VLTKPFPGRPRESRVRQCPRSPASSRPGHGEWLRGHAHERREDMMRWGVEMA